MSADKRISRRRFLSGSSAAGALLGGISVLPHGAEANERPERAATSAAGPIVLTEEEYFASPGFEFLVFHNHYLGGMQGGLQMILNGERVLDSGDFYAVPKKGVPQPALQALRRAVDRAAGTASVFGEIVGERVGYRLICRTDGKRIFVKLQVDGPFDRPGISEAGLRIYIYPKTYFSKACESDAGACVFPRQFDGRDVLLKSAHQLNIAPEDPLAAFAVERRDGALRLADNRRRSPQPWFSIDAPLSSGNTQLEIEIEPRVDSKWRRTPVIAVSQVGYHPDQKKRAVLELDPRDRAASPVRLLKLDPNGRRESVKSGLPKPWGNFLDRRYEVFDFSEVKAAGVYFLEYRDLQAGPFRIDSAIYDAAWQSTLEYFLPVQMCHVEVIEGVRSWHGACHRDDARQAPPWTNWTDSYRQGALDAGFAANEHIPGLNWGGWHDAGDFDLPGGSIALTTLALALAQEEFSPALDQTTIDREQARVLLHVPDGRSDLLQQIEYGAESLLSSYRLAGHIFGGVIEVEGYAHLGDPVNITDNLIYDPKLKPGEKVCGRSGTPDDRWAFTNRSTGLQYQAAQTLAAASRVLRKFNDNLARECLNAAQKLWEYEQSHVPVYWACSYNPLDSGFRCEEILATAELLLTTGEARFQRRLLALLPVIEMISGLQFGEHWPLPPGWTLVRVLGQVGDAGFRSAIVERAKQWSKIAAKRSRSNPWEVLFPPSITEPDWRFQAPVKNTAADVWGYAWNFAWDAFRQYYYHKHLPEIFGFEPILAAVNYHLGCHPANNETLVSGVGNHSPLAAYGFNRADWSHIPGGVISGPSLIKPEFMELKDFPFLWYQSEYVIHGAAAYVFAALAASQLLNAKSGGDK